MSEFIQLPLADLCVHPENKFIVDREHPDWKVFTESLKKYGLMHNLLVDANHRIISGQKRYHGLLEIGETHAWCRVLPTAPEGREAYIMCVVANLAARHLPPDEKTMYFRDIWGDEVEQLLAEGLTPHKVSEKISRETNGLFSLPSVRRQIMKMKIGEKGFSEDVEQRFQELSPGVQARVARAIESCKNKEKQIDKLLEDYNKNYVVVRNFLPNIVPYLKKLKRKDSNAIIPRLNISKRANSF